LKELKFEKVVTEYKFCETRKWLFDFCMPDHALAVEIEGAIWVRGRHTRGKGFLGDMEKYNYATLMGWKVLRYSPEQIDSGYAQNELRYWMIEPERDPRTEDAD